MNFATLFQIGTLYNIGMFLIALIGLGFVIGFHEFGHFLFCKLFSIRTPTFSIGFGPKIWTKKIGEATFALSAIPIGGYVEIAGQDEEEGKPATAPASTDPHLFNNKPYWQKLLVMLGGIIFNIIFAFGALSVVFMAGAPKSFFLFSQTATPYVQEIIPGSPAEQAGMQIHDRIISLNGVAVDDTPTSLWTYYTSLIGNAGKTVTLEIDRAGTPLTLTANLNSRESGKAILGAGIYRALASQNVLEALKSTYATITYWTNQIFTTLASLFSSKSLKNIGGPIMLLSQTMQGSKDGFVAFLLILAFISINLAVFNLLPLPVFDGGQVLMLTIEAITRRSLDVIRPIVFITSWVLIGLLTIYLVIKDILCLCK